MGAGLDLRFDCDVATISSRLGERSELGIEAKVCELSDQALGPHVLGAAIKMVRTEILELRAVFELPVGATLGLPAHCASPLQRI